MNIYAKDGDLIVFSYPDHGRQDDQELAAQHLTTGECYTVERTEVSGWHTDVFVKEVPNIGFNSVLFEDYT